MTCMSTGAFDPVTAGSGSDYIGNLSENTLKKKFLIHADMFVKQFSRNSIGNADAKERILPDSPLWTGFEVETRENCLHPPTS